MANIHQGSSLIATPAKQERLHGIHRMYAMKHKTYSGKIIYADIFCGSGENHIGDEIISGSPISILRGVADAIKVFKEVPHQYQAEFLFSDFVAERSMGLLPTAIERFQEENGFPVDRNKLIVTNNNGLGTFVLPIRYDNRSAEEMVAELQYRLDGDRHCRLMLTIDPNGPKSLPIDALKRLWDTRKSRIAMVLHVSATSLKRCAKASLAGINIDKKIPPNLKGLLDLFTSDPHGWISNSIGPDQWVTMMLVTSQDEPRDGWKSQGMLRMSTEEGRKRIAVLSLTEKEKKDESSH